MNDFEPIVKHDRMITHVWLNVLCAVNSSHQLGVAVLFLDPRPDAGRIDVGNGLHWDERGKAVGDCPECAILGKGKDQQISRARIEERLRALLDDGRDVGKLQA